MQSKPLLARQLSLVLAAARRQVALQLTVAGLLAGAQGAAVSLIILNYVS